MLWSYSTFLCVQKNLPSGEMCVDLFWEYISRKYAHYDYLIGFIPWDRFSYQLKVHMFCSSCKKILIDFHCSIDFPENKKNSILIFLCSWRKQSLSNFLSPYEKECSIKPNCSCEQPERDDHHQSVGKVQKRGYEFVDVLKTKCLFRLKLLLLMKACNHNPALFRIKTVKDAFYMCHSNIYLNQMCFENGADV